MEQINLSTHGKDIHKAYEQVVRGEGDFTWVVYGPDGSKAYKVAETGDDFDEFLQCFDESQIQFGLARVNPPGSDVFKNLLIGWCPDSAPLKSRSSFAQNFAEVSKLLKGYHVQVTARDTDDLDKSDLLSRLSAAAGARYSIQASRSNAPPAAASSFRPTPKPFVPKPAASVPVTKPSPPVKKEEPQIIKPAAPKKIVVEEDEWNEPELEERDLNKNPLKPNVSTWKPIGKVNLQDVIKEEKARPDPRLEVEQLKQKDKLKRDQELDDYLKTKSASVPVKAPLPSSGFNKVAPAGGISKDFGSNNGKTPAQLWAERKQKAASGASQVVKTPAPVSSAPVEEDHEEGSNVSDLKSKFDHLAVEAEESEEEDKVLPKPAPAPAPVPVAESEEEEEEEEAPAPSLPSRGSVPPPPPSRSVEPEEEEEEEPEQEQEAEEETEQEEEEGNGELVVAIAEYDYDASEDNELTFAEGQKIINIQMIDDDWWLGELENGEKGLFPSNYVTLQ